MFRRHLLWTPLSDTSDIGKPWTLLETNNLILPPKLSNLALLDPKTLVVAAHSIEEQTSTDTPEPISPETEGNAPDDETGDDPEDEEDDDERVGIYKYDISRNRWQLLIPYPKDFFSENHNICYDSVKRDLFVNNGAAQQVWRVHLDDEQRFEYLGKPQIQNVSNSPLDTLQFMGSISCVIGGQYHLFWGKGNNNHLVWDPVERTFKVLHQFEHLKGGMVSFGMVSNEKKGFLLLMGGYKGKAYGRSDVIWRYWMKEDRWEQLEVRMPDEMQSFGCVATGDGRSVIVFGGSDSKGISDKIYILDLMTMQWRQSKIRCPFKGIGFNNVIAAKTNGVECVHILQSMYRHITCPLADILAQ